MKCPFCEKPVIFVGGTVKTGRSVELYHCNTCDKDFYKKEAEKKLFLIKID